MKKPRGSNERLQDYGVFLPGAPKDQSKSLAQLLNAVEQDDYSQSGYQVDNLSVDSTTSRLLPGFENLPHGPFMTGLFNNLFNSVNLDPERIMDSLEAARGMSSRSDLNLGSEGFDIKSQEEIANSHPAVSAGHVLEWLERLERKKIPDFAFNEPDLNVLKKDVIANEPASSPDVARFNRSTLQDWAKSVNKNLLWPKPNMKQLKDAGVPATLLLSMKSLRDNLPSSPPTATPSCIMAYANLVVSSRFAFDSIINNIEKDMSKIGVDIKDSNGQIMSEMLLGSAYGNALNYAAYPQSVGIDDLESYQSHKDFELLINNLKAEYEPKGITFNIKTRSEKKSIYANPLSIEEVLADPSFYEDLSEKFEIARQAATTYQQTANKTRYNISVTPLTHKSLERAYKKAWAIYVKSNSTSIRGNNFLDFSTFFGFTKIENAAQGNIFSRDYAGKGDYEAPLILPKTHDSVLGITNTTPKAATPTGSESEVDEDNDESTPKKTRVFRVQREAPTANDAGVIDWDGRDPNSTEQLLREDFAPLAEAIGARGFQVGNWLSNKETRDVARLTHNAFEDLAQVLDWPINRLSMGISPTDLPSEEGAPLVETPYEPGDSIGLAFGARGKGRAAAHYEPSLHVINLTRQSGAGSLAHELGHALDAWMLNFFDVNNSSKFEKEFGFFVGRKGDTRLAYASEIGFMEAIAICQAGPIGRSNIAQTLTQSFERKLKPKFAESGKPIAQALAQWTANLFVTKRTLAEKTLELQKKSLETIVHRLLGNIDEEQYMSLRNNEVIQALLDGNNSVKILTASSIGEELKNQGLRSSASLLGKEKEYAGQISEIVSDALAMVNPDLIQKYHQWATDESKDKESYKSYNARIAHYYNTFELINKIETVEDLKAIVGQLFIDDSPKNIEVFLKKLGSINPLNAVLNQHVYMPDCPIVRADLIKNPPPNSNVGDMGYPEVHGYNPGYVKILRKQTFRQIESILDDFANLLLPDPSSQSMGYSGTIPHPRTLGIFEAIQRGFVEWSALVAEKFNVEKPEGMSEYAFISFLGETLMKQGVKFEDLSPEFNSRSNEKADFPFEDMPAIQALLAKEDFTGSKDYDRLPLKYFNLIRESLFSFNLYNAYQASNVSQLDLGEVIEEKKQRAVQNNPNIKDAEKRVNVIDTATLVQWGKTLMESDIQSISNYLDTDKLEEVLGSEAVALIISDADTKSLFEMLLATAKEIVRNAEKNGSDLEYYQEIISKKQKAVISLMEYIASTYPSFRYMDDQERADALNNTFPDQMQSLIKENKINYLFNGEAPNTPTQDEFDFTETMRVKQSIENNNDSDTVFDSAVFFKASELMLEGSRYGYLVDAANTLEDTTGITLSDHGIRSIMQGRSIELQGVPNYKPSKLLANSMARADMRFTDDYSFNAKSRAVKTYWSHPTELMARTFETAVYDALQKEGKHNSFLVAGVKGDMYAEGVERERFNEDILRLVKASGPEFDRLIEMTIKQREAKKESEHEYIHHAELGVG